MQIRLRYCNEVFIYLPQTGSISSTAMNHDRIIPPVANPDASVCITIIVISTRYMAVALADEINMDIPQ